MRHGCGIRWCNSKHGQKVTGLQIVAQFHKAAQVVISRYIFSMIDIKAFRENPERFVRGAAEKRMTVDFPRLTALDEQRRSI